MRQIPLLLAVACLLAALLGPGLTATSQAPKDESLPGRTVVIDIDSPESALYKIAIPNLQGDLALGPQAAEVLRNDLRLVSLFQVLDSRSFVANLAAEDLGIVADPWRAVGAQGVVKGKVTRGGRGLTLELRFYEVARGTQPVLSKTYRGGAGQLRTFVHRFGNELLRVLTGKPGAFGTRLVFGRRIGPGRKDVFVADFDGHNVSRVSGGRGVNMLPNFGPGGIWYSRLTERGMFITRSGLSGRPVVRSNGLNMGVTACGGRLYFSSTRSGNSDIYSSATDGSGVRQLTRHRGIDVSPACGPGGQIAFVSNRHGGPQVFVMNATGGSVRRVTYRGSHNQTPAWCPDAKQPLIAFTGRSGGMDIFTVNIATQEYTRLTQGQGTNKDPAFSRDCRMVAFASSRGGVFISNPQGLNQNRVISGAAETVRWSR